MDPKAMAIAEIREYADSENGTMTDEYCGHCISVTINQILDRHGV